MLKNLYYQSKDGLNAAADSFALLWHHPVLLSYYLGLLGLYALIYIAAYNLIGYTNLASISSDFQTPNTNLLSEIFPQSGGLVYLSFLSSIFINIFSRTLLSTALIVHAYSFIIKESKSLYYIATHVKRKWLIITQWSLLLTAITFGLQVISSLPLNQSIISFIVLTIGIIWFAGTFFVLPIVALTNQSIAKSIHTSTLYFFKHIIKITAGFIWFALVGGILFVSTSLINQFIIPNGYNENFDEGIFFLMNGLFTTATLLFKTKLLHLIENAKKAKTDALPADFSQF